MTFRFLSSEASPVPNSMATSSSASRFPIKLLYIAIVVGISGVLAGVLLFFCIKRAFSRKSKVSEGISHKNVKLRRFRLEELDKATMSFSEAYLLGSGAFGKVYEGEIDETRLAIKRAHADSYQSVEEFRNEVELLSRVKHRNLVSLLGYCEEQDQKILVYEYVPHGSLLEYIVGRRRKTLTWRQRVNIAIGAAKGIAHLHEGVQPSIIHRDIKPSNILVGDGFEAKVSDFGLVKIGPVGDASHVSSQIKGTPGYLDPAYCSSFHLSPFSDVYSFGVILLQLVTARRAVDSSRSDSEYHIVDWARPSLEKGTVEEIIDANLLMEACNMEMMLKMGQLGLRCVVKSPKSRPTMSQVTHELEEALQSTLSSVNKQPPRSSPRSVDREASQSFSMDGFGFHRFLVDTDGLSIHSLRMRCLDVPSVGVDIGKEDLAGNTEQTDGS